MQLTKDLDIKSMKFFFLCRFHNVQVFKKHKLRETLNLSHLEACKSKINSWLLSADTLIILFFLQYRKDMQSLHEDKTIILKWEIYLEPYQGGVFGLRNVV